MRSFPPRIISRVIGRGLLQGSVSFPLTLSLTEACGGSLSGTGTIQRPGLPLDNMTIDGSRSGSDVTLTMTVEGFTPFIFTGTWDMANTMTGVVNESGFVNAPMTVTRTRPADHEHRAWRH